MRERTRSLLTALYAVLVLALTLAPVPLTAGVVGSYDKVAHALMFAGLSFLVYWSYSSRSPLLLAIACGVAGAGLIELLQIPLPYRAGEPLDFFAGALGALGGAGLGALAFGRNRSR